MRAEHLESKPAEVERKTPPEVEKHPSERIDIQEYSKPVALDEQNLGKKFDVSPSKHGGGSYREVRKYIIENNLENREVHHIPSDCVSPLERMDGPCIEMKKADHAETASFGNSREAREYRTEQKRLIDQGDFRAAFKMDVQDIRFKFGNKYDAQIKEATAYFNMLEKAGAIYV